MRIFKSKRLIAAISGVAVVLLQDYLRLDEHTATQVVAIIVAWIVGDSIKDTVETTASRVTPKES